MTAITFEPSRYASIPEGTSDIYLSLTFDAGGELILNWIDEKHRLTVDCISWDVSTRVLENVAGYTYPIVQRFNDGRWLTVESRTRKKQKNAQVHSDSFELQKKFKAGDAIEQIIIDKQDGIWISYFDESGGVGLRRYSDRGEMTYDFNNQSGLNIFDLYAMTMDQQGSIWVYPYTDFYLARVKDDQADVILETSPVRGARAIAVGGQYVAFFGSYSGWEITVCNLRDGKSRQVSLMNGDCEMEYAQVATYADRIALRWRDGIYRFQLKDLIDASGF